MDYNQTAPDDDYRLLDDLRSDPLIVDPIPSHLHDFALAALSTRSLDVELAELLHDSANQHLIAGVRSATEDARYLKFRCTGITAEIQIDSGQALGHVEGDRQNLGVRVVASNHQTTALVDVDGSFVLHDLAEGPIRFELIRGDRTFAITEWILRPR